MPSYGRSSTVRSHRRGGPRRRFSFAPWLVIGAVVALVGAGVTAGYAYLSKDSCSGTATATIAVTPRIQSIMQRLATDWGQTQPSVGGQCASVTIVPKDSAVVAALLAGEWDPSADGAAPDVWVPDSTAWTRKASDSPVAEPMMPDLQPSLARTPTVIAMPKPMAEAAGMTGDPLTWGEIIGKLNQANGWQAYKHPEWGGFRVGLSDPQESTPGLLALMAISDTNDDGEVDPTEQATLLNLKKVISVKETSTDAIFNGLRGAAAQGADKALTYVSAFPALEQDVLNYNLSSPSVPLVAIYPKDGSAEADFPYLVLNAEWVKDKQKKVAEAFLGYARGTQGRAAFQQAGLRDANRVAGPTLVPANGVSQRITALPRAVLLPESVAHAAASWTAITRPTNILFLFDTSGSMGNTVLGTGNQNRLDLTKAAAVSALNLLDGSAQVGAWAFSTSGKSDDYRTLAPMAPLSSKNGDKTQQDALIGAIDGLKAGGSTGLYNTVWAACQEAQKKYVAGAANFIVLMTDGADDNNVKDTITLDQLVNNLRGTCGGTEKPVQIITVGIALPSESPVLQQISGATKAPTFSSTRTFDLNKVLLDFLFS